MKQSDATRCLNDLFEIIVRAGWRSPGGQLGELTTEYGTQIMKLRQRAQGQVLAPNDFFTFLLKLRPHQGAIHELLMSGERPPLPDPLLIGAVWQPEIGPTSSEVTERLIRAANARRPKLDEGLQEAA